MQIKRISKNERPRERARKFGASQMSNAELIAIVLGSGTREKNAVELANELINHAEGRISDLAKFTELELEKVKGIGPAKSGVLRACFELGKRSKAKDKRSEKLSCSADAFDALGQVFNLKQCEECWMLILDRSNQLIKRIPVSTGGVASTVVDVKVLVKHAVSHLASSVILAHNHPSGNLSPSEKDIVLTKKVKTALAYCDIKLLDHLIVCEEAYLSMSDEGIF